MAEIKTSQGETRIVFAKSPAGTQLANALQVQHMQDTVFLTFGAVHPSDVDNVRNAPGAQPVAASAVASVVLTEIVFQDLVLNGIALLKRIEKQGSKVVDLERVRAALRDD